jgi:hypothetical protein
MDPKTAQAILGIVQIALALEPVALDAVLKLMKSFEGKSASEIASAADAVWAQVGDAATKEL